MWPRDAAIVGVYTTRQGRGLGRSLTSLFMEAIHGALDDAGLSMNDVDGYISYLFPAGNGLGYEDGAIAHQFDRPMRLTAQTTGAHAVALAAAAISRGLADVVVIPAGEAQGPPGDMAAYTRPDYEFTEWTGSMTPAQFGNIACRHMHEYGTTVEQMAAVAAHNHNLAAINPGAVRFGQDRMTVESVLASRMICTPFTRPMCSLANDGASCIVVTGAARAKDCRHPPVWVAGGAFETRGNCYFEAPSLRMMEGRPAMLDAFARAGVRHDDLDIVMCYDHFAHGPLLQMEFLGFCELGEGGRYVPEVMGIDSLHPMCVDGGNLGYSHNGQPHNFKQIEIVRQFRNDVADLCPGAAEGEHTYDRAICRKVRDPKLSLGCGPLTDGPNAFTILAKD